MNFKNIFQFNYFIQKTLLTGLLALLDIRDASIQIVTSRCMRVNLFIFVSLFAIKNEYQELRRQCQDFATALLDHTRTSNELEVMLNHDPTGPIFEHGERMHLNRLKLAIKLRQKKVIPLFDVIVQELAQLHFT